MKSQYDKPKIEMIFLDETVLSNLITTSAGAGDGTGGENTDVDGDLDGSS